MFFWTSILGISSFHYRPFWYWCFDLMCGFDESGRQDVAGKSASPVSCFYQITLGPASKMEWFRAARTETFIRSLNAFYPSKIVTCLLKENIHSWYTFWGYFVFLLSIVLSTWNQIGVLCWKWFPRFVIPFISVLWVSFKHDHWEYALYCYLLTSEQDSFGL